MATIEQICEVLKAHAAGKTVQWRVFPMGEWEDMDVTEFKEMPVATLLEIEFRVKPEPREIWVGSFPRVEGSQPRNDLVFNSEAEARGYNDFVQRFQKIVKYREVTDESE